MIDNETRERIDRPNDKLREWSITPRPIPMIDTSVLVKAGNTHVICTATVEERVPSWLHEKNQGWITAEYGMLPRSTPQRMRREAQAGSQSSRTIEIQRLIGRAIRAVVDLNELGPRQIILDCDVIQADGGTRTASITGAFVATSLAIGKLMQEGIIVSNPIKDQIAAVSCGFVGGEFMLDLDYSEDSQCDSDINLALTPQQRIVEIQGTAEHNTFSFEDLSHALTVTHNAMKDIFEMQKEVILKEAPIFNQS